MKNYFLLSIATIVLQTVQSQNAAFIKNTELKKQTKLLSELTYWQSATHEEILIPYAKTFHSSSSGMRAGGEMVGNTSYDLPTNRSAPERLIVYPDGKITAAWTGATSTSSPLPDRGTFINSFDGSTWGLVPDTRIESYRTGFPSIVFVDGREVFFAHDGNNQIAIFENEGAGFTEWNENPNSLQINGTWPRAVSPEGSSYIHLLVANNDDANENNYMLYYRSPDGGTSWDIQGYRLPGIDTASGYNIMGAECYTIRAIDSEVFIAAGNNMNDLAVWKSNANGDIGSWTRTRLFEFPIPNFDGNDITDLNADMIADTIVTHDGHIAITIDNDGMMHVWSGVTYLLDETYDDAAWTYFPGVAGMWYWNESFGADSLQYLEFPLVDWDSDGDSFAGIGLDLPNYGCGFTSQAAATIDVATGIIYVVYTHPVEYTDYANDPNDNTAQSFRDLFGFYTTDNGNTWSMPINLSYTAEEYFENVSPTVFRNTVDNKIHVLWMQDQDPGNSLESEEPDPISTDNYILYRAFDAERFEPYAPTALFDYTADANTVTFQNLSVDAGEYVWDFDDGVVTVQKNPIHAFEELGTYNVCLTAKNIYGEHTDCKTISITEVTGIHDTVLADNISVYPTITTDIVHISIGEWNKPVYAELFDAKGSLLATFLLSAEDYIELSKFGNNVFTLRFTSDTDVVVKRVIVAK